MKLYFCQDSTINGVLGTSGSWMSTEFDSTLEICRLATSKEVKHFWRRSHGDFHGQVLKLTDGDFIPEVCEKPSEDELSLFPTVKFLKLTETNQICRHCGTSDQIGVYCDLCGQDMRPL